MSYPSTTEGSSQRIYRSPPPDQYTDFQHPTFQPLCGPGADPGALFRELDSTNINQRPAIQQPVQRTVELDESLGDMLFGIAGQPQPSTNTQYHQPASATRREPVQSTRHVERRNHGLAKVAAFLTIMSVVFAGGEYVGENFPVISKIENFLGTGTSPLPPLVNVIPEPTSVLSTAPAAIPPKVTPTKAH